MDKRDLETRTKDFSLRVIRFVSELPRSKATDVMGYQILKSATSIGANYREANYMIFRNSKLKIRNSLLCPINLYLYVKGTVSHDH